MIKRSTLRKPTKLKKIPDPETPKGINIKGNTILKYLGLIITKEGTTQMISIPS